MAIGFDFEEMTQKDRHRFSSHLIGSDAASWVHLVTREPKKYRLFCLCLSATQVSSIKGNATQVSYY